MTAKKVVIPPAYASKLPTSKALAALKGAEPVILPAGTSLYRAAWNAESILPLVANKLYRFGPPSGAVSRNRRPPYWWLYIADAITTCVYEAQFCAHDGRFPGHFYIDRYAEKSGQIATFNFQTELRLLDLRSETAFRMGIHDLLSSSDHEWCQWFAYQLVSEGFFSGKEAFHGTLYPSRKNRGEDAIALFSGYINRKPVRAKIQYTTVRFNKTAEYKALKRSNFRISAP